MRGLVAGALLAGVACAPAPPTADETLRDFYGAVQERDFDRLYCRMAGAAASGELGGTEAERRAGFERWARAYYEAYETGRDEGWVDLDEQGLTLVKLFALGSGTFVTYDAVREVAPDVREVESRVRFGYAHVDLSSFSAGTTFYVCGKPVGRVHAIRVPSGSREVTVEVLDGVRVVWTLAHTPAAGGCPAAWKVASARWIEESATTEEVTWVF